MTREEFKEKLLDIISVNNMNCWLLREHIHSSSFDEASKQIKYDIEKRQNDIKVLHLLKDLISEYNE